MELAPPPNRLSVKAREDYDLVLQAIEGDQRAYTRLMNRYRQSIFHMMLKMVNNREDALDLTQEAFGKAFTKLPSYAPQYAFSTWLFKIAINNCIDHVRKRKINPLSIDDPIEPHSDQDHSHHLRARMPDPEEQFIRDQGVRAIRTLITQLSDKYRLMIELRYFEELSYEEIAQELSIPLGTVKAQLFRAKELLYDLLQSPRATAYFETTTRRASR